MDFSTLPVMERGGLDKAQEIKGGVWRKEEKRKDKR